MGKQKRLLLVFLYLSGAGDQAWCLEHVGKIYPWISAPVQW
jgi:hypothetical protein